VEGPAGAVLFAQQPIGLIAVGDATVFALEVGLGVTLGADLRSQLIFCLLCSEIKDIMI